MRGLGYSLGIGMEDLEHVWKKMSLTLTNVEDTNIDLSSDKKKMEIVLVAKFFTRHSLNVEAVARMFHPIWRTRSSFEVSDAAILFS